MKNNEIILPVLNAKVDDVVTFYSEMIEGEILQGKVFDTFDDGVVIGIPTEYGLFPMCVSFDEILEVNPINSRPYLN